jgi:hypothetical protein
MLSINSDDQTRCVDVFSRADGSFGFEEFRRDTEDARGWFPIGGFTGLSFPDQEQALLDAPARISWLASLDTR